MACDAQTVLMMHCDGTDASTTFIDSSVSAKTLTANGNAQIDTAQSVFGGASGLFDGTGDYVTAADSDDWLLDGGSDLNTWTIDFRARYGNAAQNYGVAQHTTDSSNYWSLMKGSTEISFYIRVLGTTIVNIDFALTDSNNTWYHFALVKNGILGYMCFKDGVQIGSTTTDVSLMGNFTGTLDVGRGWNNDGSSLKQYNGWLDELRISKGVARWTADFTPPSAAYCGAAAVATISRLMLMGIS